MNENLTVHLKVKDFNTWRTSYNGQEKDRTTAGITNSRVFRSADDQNEVLILADVADESEARTWLASSESNGEKRRSGPAQHPVCGVSRGQRHIERLARLDRARH